MDTFWCWKPEHGDEGDGEEIRQYDAEEAAKDYAERCYSDDDYPKEQRISVRGKGPIVLTFDVFAEPSVTFSARRVTDP